MVLEEMMPYLTEEYGNAGTLYTLGRHAESAVFEARGRVADFINASPEQIIFTSGGTEANNLTFQGIRDYLKQSGKKHIIVSAIEHDSVLKAAAALIKDGFYITYLQPESSGSVSPDKVADAVREDTGLISVMYVNNETGAVNKVKEIGQICKTHSILFHADCVQAAGCYPIDVEEMQCDFVSISSHKIHGPKGVGALFARDRNALNPLIFGGSNQEFGLRGGTENVAGIVGFGKACELALKDRADYAKTVAWYKEKFVKKLMENLEEYDMSNIVSVNGENDLHNGRILNLRFEDVDGETLLLMLDAYGVCVSAGSACTSHESQPSHVLIAMGLTPYEARNSIRISFSEFNTAQEIEEAVKIMTNCVVTLRNGLI